MAKKKVPLIVAVVQPVAKRLARIEALLIEMRFEQDMQIKRLTVLREQFDHYLEGESAPRKRKKR